MKHHCQQFAKTPMTRRAMLSQVATGFGGLALAGLMGTPAFGRTPAPGGKSPQGIPGRGVLRGTHFPPKAKSVIFLYMDGGPSHVDTFDYKPALKEHNGKSPYDVLERVEPTQFDDIGTVLQSPWGFKQHGESGAWVSDLFPHVAECVDDIAFIKSMTSDFSIHTAANYFLHTGHGLQGRPSMGAWCDYGLGSENENLPGFIVLNGGLIPPGGLDNFNSGFLPARHQGSVFKAGNELVANIHPREGTGEAQRQKLDLVQSLDQALIQEVGGADALESAVANYETAYRMQTAVPELNDITGETEETKALYGLEHGNAGTRTFGRNCLLARRLVERGVRFIELTCPGGAGDRWDQHGNLADGHTKNALNVDQGIAGLIKDLKRRGMLEDTLIVWGGEFGRTPFAQGANGRDHNPFGFTMWMAGGGIKGGTTIGQTDEFGYKVIDQKCEIHDLHATMLHLMGIDHEKLTYRFSGRDIRLTDVYGNVLHDIIA